MAQTIPRGRIVWHELTTTDPDAAIAFYTKVVGWTTIPFDQMPGYRMWAIGTTPVGGVMKSPDAAMSTGARWLPFVAVADVDNAVRQAEAMGARTSAAAQDIPGGGGRFAVLADPQGALFGVFATTGEYPGHDGLPAKGEFSWHELATTDGNAAWHFYHQLFGWEKMHAMDMGPDGMYQMFGRASVQLGGMYAPKASAQSGPPRWLCYVKVANADSATALTTKLGGRITSGPMEVPGGDRITMCVDPQGGAFAVHSVATAAAKAAAAVKPAPKKQTPAAAMKTVAATKKAVPKKKAASKKKAAPKIKAAPRKKAAPKKKAAPRKKLAAKKRPAPRKKAASKKKRGAKKARRR